MKYRCPNCQRIWAESDLNDREWCCLAKCGYWVQGVYEMSIAELQADLQQEENGIPFVIAYADFDKAKRDAREEAAWAISQEAGRIQEEESSKQLSEAIAKVITWPLRRFVKAARRLGFVFQKTRSGSVLWGPPGEEQWG